MAVSQEDLEQKRSEVDKLRQQIIDTQAKADAAVQAQSNEVEAATLDAEKAKLEAQLAAAKEQAKVSNVKAASANLQSTLKAARDAAGEITPPGVLVDTNAESQPKNTTGATVAVENGVVSTSPDGVTTVVAPDEKNGGSN